MSFPLEDASFQRWFWDLSLWLAITAMTLLISSGLLSVCSGRTNLHVNNKRLRNVALAVSTLFLITVAIRIISIILAV